jgi:hypothetical protein
VIGIKGHPTGVPLFHVHSRKNAGADSQRRFNFKDGAVDAGHVFIA